MLTPIFKMYDKREKVGGKGERERERERERDAIWLTSV
jgi:hypothetical protein